MRDKKCTCCGEIKSIKEFHKDRQKSTGLCSYCKDCVVKKSKEQYCKHRERKLRSSKKYFASEHGKVIAYEVHLRQLKKFPERKKAYDAVKHAIKKGELKKQPCKVCESIKSEAHHEDYSKPLEVLWFCSEHHKQHHRRANE